MRYIFDLDGTVIDSTHRQGDTLDDWRRLNTARNVALDSGMWSGVTFATTRHLPVPESGRCNRRVSTEFR